MHASKILKMKIYLLQIIATAGSKHQKQIVLQDLILNNSYGKLEKLKYLYNNFDYI